MNAMRALERARAAWEASQPQYVIDLFPESAAPPYPPDAAGAADHRGGRRPGEETATRISNSGIADSGADGSLIFSPCASVAGTPTPTTAKED